MPLAGRHDGRRRPRNTSSCVVDGWDLDVSEQLLADRFLRLRQYVGFLGRVAGRSSQLHGSVPILRKGMGILTHATPLAFPREEVSRPSRSSAPPRPS